MNKPAEVTIRPRWHDRPVTTIRYETTTEELIRRFGSVEAVFDAQRRNARVGLDSENRVSSLDAAGSQTAIVSIRTEPNGLVTIEVTT